MQLQFRFFFRIIYVMQLLFFSRNLFCISILWKGTHVWRPKQARIESEESIFPSNTWQNNVKAPVDNTWQIPPLCHLLLLRSFVLDGNDNMHLSSQPRRCTVRFLTHSELIPRGKSNLDLSSFCLSSSLSSLSSFSSLLCFISSLLVSCLFSSLLFHFLVSSLLLSRLLFSCLVLSLFLCLSVSLCFCLLSLSLSVSVCFCLCLSLFLSVSGVVCCGVVCVLCCVLLLCCCCVVLCCVCGVVCGAAWHAEKTFVCRFKTPPCVSATQRTCGNTCTRCARTHGDVSNVHTVTFWIYTRRFFGRTHGGEEGEGGRGEGGSPSGLLTAICT